MHDRTKRMLHDKGINQSHKKAGASEKSIHNFSEAPAYIL